MILIKVSPSGELIDNGGAKAHQNESLNQLSWRVSYHRRKWRPLTDVYETDAEFVIRMEIAGMIDTDFSIDVDHQMISISGCRQDVNLPRAFHQMEIPFGDFRVVIELPSIINLNEVAADYSDGFLQIHAPKAQPTPIRVQKRK
jgi:HSP20 family protein